MKVGTKSVSSALVIVISLLAAACSGVPQSASSSSTGGSTTSFAIGGTISGLAQGSTGLVLQNNAGDNLAISANGSFTFKTLVTTAQGFSVSVFALPTPAQTCTVSGGTGSPTANITSVLITCSTGTGSIGGSVTGLTGTGLVLQDIAGGSVTADDLTITGNGSFTFKNALTIGSTYAVSVLTQPTVPTQTCTVTNGTGTVAANVGNIQVTCSIGTLSVGGTVAGLAKGSSGITLLDNGGDSLTVTANGNFTFPSLLTSGSTYAVTIKTQPTGPAQTCTITTGTGSGTITANVTGVQVICPAIFHTIGGQVVGVLGTKGNMVLQDNGGDNLPTPGNGPFTFVTPIADGSTYDVDIFVGPGTQIGIGCIVWGFQGTAVADVTDVTVDCGHNDWTWMDGDNTGNQKGSFTKLAAPTTPPAAPTQNSSTPGGRRYPATWTDQNGNLWLFGGYGYSYDPNFPLQPGFFSDMWEYTGTANYFGGFNNLWQVIQAEGAALAPDDRWGAVTWTDAAGDLWLFGGANDDFFYNDLWKFNIASSTWTLVSGGANQKGVYGTKGTASAGNIPGSRWGASAHIDASGRVWLFGGFGFDDETDTSQPNLLNDLWMLQGGQWTWVNGSSTVNQTGNYGTQGTAAASNVPGARQSSASWLDASGNFWLFGGFDLDSQGHPDALNDLWEFKGGQWTWVSGANVVNQPAVYGTQGVAAASNVPGAAWSPAAWIDLSGNLWLFGGQGFDSTGNGSLSDIWEFNVTTSQWVWVKGPGSVSQAGVYGTQPNPTVWPHVTNNPGARWAPGYWTVDVPAGSPSFREFWIFGGEGEDSTGSNGNFLLDDLFRYLPYP
jgi:Galactose oxidase, central domain